jgi:hypothetical protein
MNDPPSLIQIQKTDNRIACSIMPWVFKLAWTPGHLQILSKEKITSRSNGAKALSINT